MIDLTEKILSLDLEAESILKNMKLLSVEAKDSVNRNADQKTEESQQAFEKEKESKAKALEESFKEKKKSARSRLDKKMRAFDARVKIDSVVEDLINVAKEKICR